MKVRSNFVTNSSSSSFIIGKKDDETITIESVFQIVKEFYREYLFKRDAVIQYITDNPKLGLIYCEYENEDYCKFKFIEGNKWDDKNNAINKLLKCNFGISVWDYFNKDYTWLECETYQDYQRYWLSKMEKQDKYKGHAPFTIADFFEEREICWLHWNGNKIHNVNSKSDVLAWYYEYIEKAFENIECDKCGSSGWCDKEECKNQKTLFNDKNIPEDNACLYLLGRVCIYSECGYIPEYVVDMLSKISEYSCNHMG